MTKNNQNTKTPRLTIDVPRTGKNSLAKLVVPRVKVEDLGQAISKLLTKMQEEGIEGTVVRGILTVY